MYIDWGTKIIYVLKTDLSLVQSTPTEIYNLELNSFHLKLKDLEDDENGMTFPNTHNHNTEVSLGGLTYARVIEMINGYTITFEDGQYAVNLIGANSNVGDVVNVNQVSVRSNNSAGMISSPEIQYASYNGGVTIDSVNGTDSSVYPYGTPLHPCKTAANSYAIRMARGFKKIYLMNDLHLSGIPDGVLNSLHAVGVTGNRKHILTFDNVLATDCIAENLQVTGNFKPGSTTKIINCSTSNATNVQVKGLNSTIQGGTYSCTDLDKCIISGDIKLVSGGTFSGVDIVFEGDYTTIDMQGYNNCTVSLDISSGYFKLLNARTGCLAEFNLRGGELELDTSCTGGDFYAEGYGTLFGDPEALGMTVKANHLLALETIPGPIWDETVTSHLTAGSTGKALSTASSGGVDYDALSLAVWNSLLSGSETASSILIKVKKIVNDNQALILSK